MTPFDFGILGPLELRRGGDTIDIGAMQLRRLMCMLLLAPGRPVPTSTVLECLWPSDDSAVVQPENAAKTLRIYVSRLRRLLGDAVGPKFDVRGYWLDVSEEHVDAPRFEALLRVAGGSADEDPEGAIISLGAALALWRGPALADCRDEPWAVGAAARLDELRLTAEERLADVRLRLGDHDSLCGELEHFVRRNPFRERSWAQLMLALYRSGRQADALRTFQRLRRILGEELGIEPSKELAELDTAIVRQDASLDLKARPRERHRLGGDDQSAVRREGPAEQPLVAQTGVFAQRLQPDRGLPAQLTSFIGRRRELDELQALVKDHRLVTLTGPGGVGKTRLAIEVANSLRHRWPSDAMMFVDFSAIDDPDEVGPQLAVALGVEIRRGSPIVPTLGRAIGDEALLLLLDNCEHVVDSCAASCEALLRACPSLSAVATSRQPLGIDGESIYPVPPLSLPTDSADHTAGDSVELFVERARVLIPSFVLDDSNAAAIASICRRVDGIALAVELAAARVNVLTPAQISAVLEEQFRLLARAAHSGIPRHRTLDALIGWSYDLLDAAERSLLRRLTIFTGGFDLDGALAVAEPMGEPQWAFVDRIASLVNKNLVVADTRGAVARYRLLETIRQYAMNRLLDEDGEAALKTARDAHAAFYLDFSVRAGEGLWSPDQFAWMERLEAEFLNVRAAFAHFIARGSTRDAMRLIADLGSFCSWSGHQREWGDFAEKLEGHPELDELDALSVAVSLLCAQVLGLREPESASLMMESVLARARELGDDSLIARALDRLHWQSRAMGDQEKAARLHEESLVFARRGRDKRALLLALAGSTSHDELAEVLQLAEDASDLTTSFTAIGNLTDLALVVGDYRLARSYAERALTIAEAGRGERARLDALVNLGLTLVLDGEVDRAKSFYTSALPVARRQVYPVDLGYVLLGLGLCASHDGDLARAATLFGAARGIVESSGFAVSGREAIALEAEEVRIRSFIGAPMFEAARHRGRCLSKHDAADLALGRLGPALPSKSGPGSLA